MKNKELKETSLLDEIISEDRQQQIDKVVLKCWICAKILFETIDNLFIINMFKTLNNGYSPLSYFTLFECILDKEVAKAKKAINNELESEMNLTLTLNKINNILNKIGVEKFVAVVTNYKSNIRCARRLVNEEFNFILDICYGTHAINLIAHDLSETKEIKGLIKKYKLVINFFHYLSIANKFLKKGLIAININRDKLKIYSSMWQDLEYDEASCKDLLTELHAYKHKEKPCIQQFKKAKKSSLIWWFSMNAPKELLIELAIKIFSIPPSQALEFTIQQFDKEASDSFNPIFESHSKQLEEINYNKLSIKEIVDFSNPTFVKSNNLFINNQSSVLDTATK
ncbi:31543_t:CDS:2 [Gigaspora margarita]|uniref:31543_t:CDS:1 n=1 Tax=Gigaspora margarita TaxID=4874 RepID=A0ABN7W1F9_GIGMA|nr:31543_t:CDS:2 [Gigaspora margarita]